MALCVLLLVHNAPSIDGKNLLSEGETNVATYVPMPGENVTETAAYMVEMADQLQEPVTAGFNDIELTAKPGDKPAAIVEYYLSECDRRQQEWENSPEGQQALRKQEEARKRAEAFAAQPLKPFTIKNLEDWSQIVEINKDAYGSAVIRYAAYWAFLMEQSIAKGSRLQDVAEDTSHEADVEGITGFMYGAAVSILVHVWEHGDEFRIWKSQN